MVSHSGSFCQAHCYTGNAKVTKSEGYQQADKRRWAFRALNPFKYFLMFGAINTYSGRKSKADLGYSIFPLCFNVKGWSNDYAKWFKLIKKSFYDCHWFSWNMLFLALLFLTNWIYESIFLLINKCSPMKEQNTSWLLCSFNLFFLYM